MPNRSGVTLMEVLVVLAVLGLVALILIPMRLMTGPDKYFDVMKDDIKNLASAEEIYYAEHFTYTSRFQDLDFSPSEGVTLTLANATEMGWSVIARHSSTEPDAGCALYYGSVETASMEFLPSAPGEILCTVR